ncbi:MAG: hypothetical protein JO063_05335, partial [Pseudonocardiales bacterium]|nr:hypothetical protein [Pseudonocardiales bacterium]
MHAEYLPPEDAEELTVPSPIMDSLRSVRQWPVDTVAVAVVDASGVVVGSHGPQNLPFRLTSVTKLLSAYAVLLAVQEG